MVCYVRGYCAGKTATLEFAAGESWIDCDAHTPASAVNAIKQIWGDLTRD